MAEAAAGGGEDAGGAEAEKHPASATQVPELEFSVIFPRRKTVNANGKGCDGEPVFVTREFITPYFKMPMVAACAELGVCPTAMKKACRKLGIVKWPYRRTVAALRHAKLAAGPEQAGLDAQGGAGQFGVQQSGGQGSGQMQAQMQMQRQQQHAQQQQQQQWQQLKQMQIQQMQMQQMQQQQQQLLRMNHHHQQQQLIREQQMQMSGQMQAVSARVRPRPPALRPPSRPAPSPRFPGPLPLLAAGERAVCFGAVPCGCSACVYRSSGEGARPSLCTQLCARLTYTHCSGAGARADARNGRDVEQRRRRPWCHGGEQSGEYAVDAGPTQP